MNEEAQMRDHNFQTIKTVRDDHYQKVQTKYKQLDALGYAAHKEHMTEVEKYQEEQRMKMEQDAIASYQRFVRDETAYLDKRTSLERKMDEEAQQSLFNLGEISKDINLKTQKYEARI